MRYGLAGVSALTAVLASGCAGSPVDSHSTVGGNGGGLPRSTAPEPSSVICEHRGDGKEYQVGTGREYATLGDVPFETLGAGDTVRVFYKAEPYRDKLMIGGIGTEAQPIRLCGVAGPDGERPIIDGEGAVTRADLDFPYDGHQLRGLIVVGHPHDRPYDETPEHVIIEGLEIRNAAVPNTFVDKAGQVVAYPYNVAGIFGQRVRHLTIRDNVIHDNGNGVFVGTGGGMELSADILIEGNYIFDNGYADRWSEHNVYNEAQGVVYQYNRFGPTRRNVEGDPMGNAIKERSAGVVIRYNWIEEGSHLIDIVDSQEARDDNVGTPAFQTTHVYGNVFIARRFQGSLIHYGGDSGLLDTYRKGVLHFYQNTVIVQNEGYQDYDEQDIFELSTNDEHLDARNNLFWSTRRPRRLQPICVLGRRDSITSGIATFANNMFTPGWSPVDPSPRSGRSDAHIFGLENSLIADSPGFADVSRDDFRLVQNSPARGAGQTLARLAPALHPAAFQYVPHQKGAPRRDAHSPALGAFH